MFFMRQLCMFWVLFSGEPWRVHDQVIPGLHVSFQSFSWEEHSISIPSPSSTSNFNNNHPLAHQVLCSILGFRQLTCLTCHAYFADNKSLKDLPQVKMLITDTQESNSGLSRSIPKSSTTGQAALFLGGNSQGCSFLSQRVGVADSNHTKKQDHTHTPTPTHPSPSTASCQILFPDYEPACGWCWSRLSHTAKASAPGG